MREGDGYGAIATRPSASAAVRSPGSARCDVPRDAGATHTIRRAAALGDTRVSSTAIRTSSMPATARTNSSTGSKAPRTRTSPRAGGGILATVRATRAASEDDLAPAARRADALLDEGVTTVEIKSGYGLDTANELKQLRVARALGRRWTSTCARRCSPRTRCRRSSRDRADAYIDYVCDDTHACGRARRTRRCGRRVLRDDRLHAAQTRRVFEAARAHRLPVKLHADQLSDMRRRALAAEFGALSADHLEYTSEAGVAAMARGGHGRGAAAGRVLCVARDAAAADRGVARARRADRDLDRLQSGNVAGDVAAADAEHGVHAVPADAAGSAAPASRVTRRVRSASPIAATLASGSAPTSRSGTSTSRPSSPTGSAASLRRGHRAGGRIVRRPR